MSGTPRAIFQPHTAFVKSCDGPSMLSPDMAALQQARSAIRLSTVSLHFRVRPPPRRSRSCCCGSRSAPTRLLAVATLIGFSNF